AASRMRALLAFDAPEARPCLASAASTIAFCFNFLMRSKSSCVRMRSASMGTPGVTDGRFSSSPTSPSLSSGGGSSLPPSLCRRFFFFSAAAACASANCRF
ncbi:hypothetical protein Vretifemale_16395, partial [Volvox reticuliferus]